MLGGHGVVPRAGHRAAVHAAGTGRHDRGRRAHRRPGAVYREVAGTQSRACGAARLHDIGKLRVPTDVLATPGPLSDHQWEFVHRHPDEGADILAPAPGLQDIAEVVRQPHEHHDGTGCLRGLAGQQIALGARIVSVCNTRTAMRAQRP